MSPRASASSWRRRRPFGGRCGPRAEPRRGRAPVADPDQRREWTESTSKALDHWADRQHVQLDFSRPGKPVDNTLVGEGCPVDVDAHSAWYRMSVRPRRRGDRVGGERSGNCRGAANVGLHSPNRVAAARGLLDAPSRPFAGACRLPLARVGSIPLHSKKTTQWFALQGSACWYPRCRRPSQASPPWTGSATSRARRKSTEDDVSPDQQCLSMWGVNG